MSPVIDPERDARARGARMVAARELAGLTQMAVAKELGVSRQAVGAWEDGGEIKEKKLGQLAILYKVSRGWLRYGEGRGPVGFTAEGHREIDPSGEEEVITPPGESEGRNEG